MMPNKDKNSLEINKKTLLELLWFPVFGLIWLFFELKIKHVITEKVYLEKIEFFIGWATFGLLHILASNILSFLYNLNRYIIPFSPLVTPKRLKILGGIIVAGSVILYFLQQ